VKLGLAWPHEARLQLCDASPAHHVSRHAACTNTIADAAKLATCNALPRLLRRINWNALSNQKIATREGYSGRRARAGAQGDISIPAAETVTKTGDRLTARWRLP